MYLDQSRLSLSVSKNLESEIKITFHELNPHTSIREYKDQKFIIAFNENSPQLLKITLETDDEKRGSFRNISSTHELNLAIENPLALIPLAHQISALQNTQIFILLSQSKSSFEHS